MKKTLQILLLILGTTFVLPAPLHAQITVTTNHTAQELAEYLVGRGIQISNATLKGYGDMSGKFKNRNNLLAMDSGIVLTNGFARNVRSSIGVDNPPSAPASNDLSLRGDADIDNALHAFGLPPTVASYDACILEFDFVPIGDTVSFMYSFASEEYPTYNCSPFNDIFLFYISGPGIAGKKNMAIVPGTNNIPVSINSINDGTVNPRENITYCTSLGAGSPFPQYYIDNTAAPSIVYSGMTKVLRAYYPVRPCVTYHLKMVIADVSDGIIDSGVFLEAGSFQSDYAAFSYNGPVDENNEPLLTEGCDNATITVRYSRPLSTPKEIMLNTGGTADNNTDLLDKVPPSVILPPGATSATFTISALQDLAADDDEYLVIYALPKSCSTAEPIITDSIRIRIRDYKTAKVLPDTSGLCPGDPGIQLNLVTPGMSSLNWTPATGLSNTTIPNPVAQPAATTLYSVTGNLTPTCRAKGTALVIIKDSTSLTWTQRNISCFGHDGMITVFAGPIWQNPQYSINGSPFSPGNIFTSLDTGWYVIRVRDASGCETQKTILLVRLEAVTATITTKNANCMGVSGHVYVTAHGGQWPYQYSLNGLNYQTDSSIILGAGPHTLYVKDDFGCPFSMPFNIGTDPPIQLTVSITADSCRGLDDGTITINASGGSGVYSYSTNGGINYETVNPLYREAGNYTLMVLDDNECTGSLDIVVPLNNTLVIDAGPDSTICEGKTIQLSATGNANYYLWSPATGLNNNLALQPFASPVVTTQYKLTARSGRCESIDSLTIFVNKAPVANAGADTAICYGDKAQLHGSGGVDYSWAPVQNISNRFIQNPQVYPRATTRYWLHVTDNKGCRSLTPDTVLIRVVPTVKVFAGNDTIAAINQPLQLNAVGNGATNYVWQPSTGLNNPDIANPVAVLQNHQTYLVTASTPEGCSGSATVNIKVYKGPEIYVAGAFTPNGDNNNDILFAIPSGIKKFSYFRIFNRWGNEVFSTTDYRKGWNGKWKDAEQQADTYIWMAEATDVSGKVLFRKGTVVLIR